MAVSYKKLWKLLIDKDIKKKDLCAKAGISIPRVSYEQAAAGIAVPRSQIRIGDLVAFNSPVSHVGIYVGDGKFIHSPHTGDVVKITNLSAMKLTAVRRMTGALAG